MEDAIYKDYLKLKNEMYGDYGSSHNARKTGASSAAVSQLVSPKHSNLTSEAFR